MIIFLSIFILFCIFIIGSLFGSFFSLATYRLPKHEDITHTRSYCPNCNHKLSFFDLIPILSFILRKGKCKYCSQKISPRYILLETLNGLFFVLVYLAIYYFVKSAFNTLVYSMCFYILYAFIFVFIGSNIMRNNMNLQESNKKGVYIAELIVAFVVFIILTSSALIIMKNYSVGLNDAEIKSEIINATASKIEEIKINTYENDYYNDLSSTSGNYTYNGREYQYDLNVKKYSEESNVKYDFIKIIEVKLTRTVAGKDIEYSLSDLVFNYDLMK